MGNETLLFAVVYSQALSYFKDFCDCARQQTRKDFDVFVVNDGCDTSLLKNNMRGLKATIEEACGGIAENRLQGIEYAREHNYKYIFLCDADDTFTDNRIERSIEAFEKSGADIIVCNLNVANEKCETIIPDYFSKEIHCERWIDCEFLMNKNIIGMSNSALRVSSLPENIKIPDIQIVDWYLFTILLREGLRAKYITDSLVNYRQYNANMIGITNYDVQSFRKLASYKHTHYKMLVDRGYDQYQDMLTNSEELQNIPDDIIKEIINRNLMLHKQPLWWQIIEK